MIAAIKTIFLLGFLIFIHELGHFTVAKLCRIKVNQFALGFGPKILKKKFGETEYSLRILPLGGFVSMEGEVETIDTERSFSKASIGKRIAVVLAGPIVNIVFAIIVYFILMLNNCHLQSNIVQSLEKGFAAEQAGIMQGEIIKTINGKDIDNRYEYNEAIKNITNEEVILEVENIDKGLREVSTKFTEISFKDIGIWVGEDAKIASVEKSSPSSGYINVGDEVIKVNGITTNKDASNVIDLVRNSKEEKIKLTIIQNGEEKTVEVVPNIIKQYYLGVTFDMAENTLENRIIFASEETKIFLLSIYINLKEMFTGNVSVSQMTGPIGIGNMIVDTNSVYEYIYLLALISLSLGVSNLLPIPGLDGGKLIILIIEAIRKKPLKQEVEASIAMIGFTILILLSIYVTYIDILRI